MLSLSKIQKKFMPKVLGPRPPPPKPMWIAGDGAWVPIEVGEDVHFEANYSGFNITTVLSEVTDIIYKFGKFNIPYKLEYEWDGRSINSSGTIRLIVPNDRAMHVGMLVPRIK